MKSEQLTQAVVAIGRALRDASDMMIRSFLAFSEEIDQRARSGEFGKWPWQRDYGLWPWQRQRRS